MANDTKLGSRDTIAPTVSSFSPADEATGVAVASNILLTFSESIQFGTGNIVLKNASGAMVETYNAATSANVSISGSVLTINPTADLGFGTGYSVEFSADSVKDITGNSFAGITTYNFSTLAASNSPPSNTVLSSFVAEFDNKTAFMVGNVELNGALYVLSTKAPSSTDYRIDPDGTKCYLTSVFVTKIGSDQILTQVEIGRLYAGGADSTGNNNNALNRGTIGAVNGNIKVFFSEKDSGASYGQNGYAYSIDAQSLTGSKSTVFNNANWGWFPSIDSSGDVTHFSFAGYYMYKNTTFLYSIAPTDAVLSAENQKLVTAGLAGNLTTTITGDALSVQLVDDLKVFVGSNLAGSVANQTFIGTLASDVFTGGAGADTVVYTGARATYTVATTSTGLTVNDNVHLNNLDTLSKVERLQFSDVKVAYDTALGQSTGNAVLLLGVVLGNTLLQAKKPLLGAVTDLFDQGYSLQVLSGAVMRLDIWNALAGGNSNTQIANYLLTTVNGSAPDASTLASAVNALTTETGAAQGTFLSVLAASASNQTQVGLVGLASTGIDFGTITA